MGRFDTLNEETKDLVECMLPALAKSFKVEDVVDIIPQDIRMRQWDTERRDHIKDQTENDPRNWGVQFLKDLKTINRVSGWDLATFHAELYEKVALHEETHPWCRLSDIKEIKLDVENPGRKEAMANPVQPVSDSSTDSYLEELVEPNMPKGSSKRRARHEVYEARVQESSKRRKTARLRRANDGSFVRPEKGAKKQHSQDRGDSILSTQSNANRPSTENNRRRHDRYILQSDGEESYGSPTPRSAHPRRISSYSTTPAPNAVQPSHSGQVDASNEPLAVQKLAAELEVAEAELKAARAKFEYIQARELAEQQLKQQALQEDLNAPRAPRG
ncbi:hypothetical protein LEMA_P065430.1 [Plenodomus lingam JN3]|uniref:Uncharacterized protein n=1 Tax=Leptosphaeria maculans (strain JN3 / isolate v23.1.3 / race Av1-4-5-6-7-8) TaxID=985895 RepID=E4ZGJ7_LEPMJ|nr:hypothetical protein LEMA_P065430.1 [Plenodomus lingam JN3]CBX90417.1 hypothetical protein LEMA_P065430.1 [Plenodomus lingam JN3]